MKQKHLIFFILPMCIMFSCNATPLEPNIAIENVRANCGAISQEFKSMKTMAQVNTAVTGVGTAAGAGATIVGIAKSNLDSEIDKLITRIEEAEDENPRYGLMAQDREDFINNVITATPAEQTDDKTQANMEQRSKNLGNWRTGLLAANTATNIAGTIIAANNRTNQDLRTRLNKCVQSITDLQDSKMQAQINNTDAELLQKMDRIITACRDYDTLDISKIDNKAKGAAISSGAGIAVGAAGTITSATANSDKIRENNTESGMAKEKNLNTASNVLAAGATVASGVATVFNAQQISTLNRAQKIATQCSEALNQ